MKILIIGSRFFSNYTLLRQKCTSILSCSDSFEIISCGQGGIDNLTERYARENGIRFVIYKINWRLNGNLAVLVRNLEILEDCTHVIAFWDGKSIETRHLIIKISHLGKELRIIKYSSRQSRMPRISVALRKTG
jgi:hypothetical protein